MAERWRGRRSRMERSPTVVRRAERDALPRHRGVGLLGVPK